MVAGQAVSPAGTVRWGEKMAAGAHEIVGQQEFLRWSVARAATFGWLALTQAAALVLAVQIVGESVRQAVDPREVNVIALAFLLLWALEFALAAWKWLPAPEISPGSRADHCSLADTLRRRRLSSASAVGRDWPCEREGVSSNPVRCWALVPGWQDDNQPRRW
jgi:hypothetical protein